jgi:hypothetical protein
LCLTCTLFCTQERGEEGVISDNNVTIPHERQKIILESQRYIADIAINQDILFLAETRIQVFKKDSDSGIAASLEVLDVVRNNRTVATDSTSIFSDGDTISHPGAELV